MGDKNAAHKVGEIFLEAGHAFTKLAELTMQMNPEVEAPPGSKWSEEEIETLRNAVLSFGTDLSKISEIVKTRSISQVKSAIKRKIYLEAGAASSKKQQTKKRSSVGNESGGTNALRIEPISYDDFSRNLEAKRRKLDGEPKEPIGNISHSALDVENLVESQPSFKKLDEFINSPVGAVSDLLVSNPPPLPPFDLVSDPS